jgi:hypothetical protein
LAPGGGLLTEREAACCVSPPDRGVSKWVGMPGVVRT